MCHVLKTLAKLRILTYIILYDFSLEGNASYQTNGGIKSLHLDGLSGYAEIPAVNFRKSSFSIALGFNVHNSHYLGHLVSDWSSPWQFRLYVYGRKVFVELRRSGEEKTLFRMKSDRLVRFFSTCSLIPARAGGIYDRRWNNINCAAWPSKIRGDIVWWYRL